MLQSLPRGVAALLLGPMREEELWRMRIKADITELALAHPAQNELGRAIRVATLI